MPLLVEVVARAPNVTFWHRADMLNALTNVRFWEQSGHDATGHYVR